MQTPPATFYQQQLEKQEAILHRLLKKSRQLGWSRFFVFIATVIIAYEVFVAAGAIGISVVVMGIAVLLYLVSKHANNNEKMAHTKTLIQINEEELQVLNHQYGQRYDGHEYLPHTHDYANDLDLFGPASLYQFINRCYTEQGRGRLAQNLLQPISPLGVPQRHEALKELASLLEWRQQLQALALETTITTATEQKTTAWLEEEQTHFTSPAWKAIVPIYAVITLTSLAATLFDYISVGLFSLLFVCYFFISMLLSRKAVKAYIQLSGIVKEISALQHMVQWIEDVPFQAALLKELQQRMKSGNEKAATQIKELKAILDRFDMRLSIVGILFLNPFLLWDVRQMTALNQWRQQNKHLLPIWFEVIAEMEVVNTLATLHFNQPQWCLPAFSTDYFTFQGEAIGHPLIPAEERVDNSFTLKGTSKIALVTGSNMAGKSTFLRSLGVNTVLAQLGAPVCAKALALSPVRLMSSMRIADNLAENTSTFYAELKKLKTIIEAVNQHEPAFILLDEILRGTNSFDRHTGSEALMKQFIKENAVAVIATHDVELANLERPYPQSLENYHFDVQVAGEELYFDYKLKPGVCTSLNASILMKKIGIELS